MANRFSSLFPAWDLFDQVHKELQTFSSSHATWGTASTHLWSDDNFAYIELPVAGASAEQIEISVEGDRLSLKILRELSTKDCDAERHGAAEPGQKWLRRERDCAATEATITLPFDAEASAVEAELHNGMLWIRVPRAEATKPRRIPVLAVSK